METEYKGQTFDLDRVVFPTETEWDGVCFQAGMTVGDVIRQCAGIGFGGHLNETSDDEEAIYTAIARTPNEYRWILATRESYCEVLEHWIKHYSHIPKVFIK